MACFEEQRLQLASLTELLSRSGGEVITEAPRAVERLPAVEACRPQAILDRNARPRAPDTAERVELQNLTARATATYDLGRFTEAIALGQRARELARATGDRAQEARLLLLLGRANENLARYGDATTLLELAVQAGRAADDVAAELGAWTTLALVHLFREPAEAERWARFAQSVAERVGDREPALQADLHYVAGSIAEYRDRQQTAEVEFEQAIVGYQKAHDASGTARTLYSLASVKGHLGRPDEAIALARRALSLDQEVVGPEHPLIADDLGLLAETLYSGDQADEALVTAKRALATSEHALGNEHPIVARALATLAEIYGRRGDFDAAERAATRSLHILKHLVGIAGDNYVAVLSIIAENRANANDWAGARAAALELIAIEHTHPDLTPLIAADGYAVLGRAAEAQHQFGPALKHFNRSISIVHKVSNDEHNPHLGEPLCGIGDVHRAQKRPQQAIASYERALRALENLPSFESANVRFHLAMAYWDAGRDRAASRSLALTARRSYAEKPNPSRITEAARIDRWLATHAL
jgi:serine/threonine-protein kinase